MYTFDDNSVMPPYESMNRPRRRRTTPTNGQRKVTGRGTNGGDNGFNPNQPRDSEGKWRQTGSVSYYKPRTQVGPTRLTKKKAPAPLKKRASKTRWEKAKRAVWIAFHWKRWMRNRRRFQAKRETKQWLNSNW